MSNQINIQTQQVQIAPRQVAISANISAPKLSNDISNSSSNHQPQQQTPIASKYSNMNVKNSSLKLLDNSSILSAKQVETDINSKPKIYTKKQVETLVNNLNKTIGILNTFIQFGVDKNNIFYVAVIDKQTDKILSRFPAAQATNVLTKLKESIGIIFDAKG